MQVVFLNKHIVSLGLTFVVYFSSLLSLGKLIHFTTMIIEE